MPVASSRASWPAVVPKTSAATNSAINFASELVVVSNKKKTSAATIAVEVPELVVAPRTSAATNSATNFASELAVVPKASAATCLAVEATASSMASFSAPVGAPATQVDAQKAPQTQAPVGVPATQADASPWLLGTSSC